jgi:ABC-type cobalamin/Fe3+-siderophores transport system ATPase subunit
MMNLQEEINRIKTIMGLVTENIDGGKSIILFGPQGVGKSTLSKQLGEKLGMKVVGSDDVIDQGDWASEETWSKGWQVRKENEYKGMVEYLKNNIGKPVILDVGGSHGVWDGKMLKNIMGLIEKYPNRFLIIPSDNEKENQEFLRGRLLKREMDALPFNIKYWEAVLSGDVNFGNNFDDDSKEEFIKRIEAVKKGGEFKTMAINGLQQNQKRYEALKNGVEWMEYDKSSDKKFDFQMNKIEDYSKFFIDTMKNSGIANHIIYNKGKSSEELVDEIITKLR